MSNSPSYKVLSPVMSPEKALDEYLKQKGIFARFYSRQIEKLDNVEMILKPFCQFEFDVNVSLLKKQLIKKMVVVVDGLTGVGAIVTKKDAVQFREISTDCHVLKQEIDSEEALDIAKNIVQKSIYLKYKLFPKCTLNSKEHFYRGLYLFYNKKTQDHILVSADTFEIQ